MKSHPNENQVKRMEEALEDEMIWRKILIEQSRDGIVVLDQDGKVIEANQRYTEMLGYSAEEVLNLYVWDWDAQWSREHLMEMIRLIDATGDHFETRHRRKDGTIYDAEISTNGAIIHGQKLVFCVCRDITERKRMEQALRESEEHYRTLFEHLPIPAFTKNREGKYTSSNTECQRYWNINPIGRTDAELLPHETAVALREADLRVMETGETLTIEEHLIGTSLGERHALSRKVPLRDGNGDIVGILGASLDITERKRAEADLRILNEELELRVRQRTAELEALNKELKEFAYVVSNDLKAPLRGIRLLAQWLHEDYDGTLGEQGQEQLNLLVGRVKRMENLIDGILRYSRAAHGSEYEESIDLNTLVPQIIEMFMPPAHIAIRIEDELPVIHSDPIRITQVFQNLLGNALKFMDAPEGKIGIGCVDAGDMWTFRVEDNGPGIEPQHHERIFRIFQTNTPQNESESSGIGLAVVKKIVELYGGRVWVDSAPGQGSRFYFTWPKSPGDQKGEEQ